MGRGYFIDYKEGFSNGLYRTIRELPIDYKCLLSCDNLEATISGLRAIRSTEQFTFPDDVGSNVLEDVEYPWPQIEKSNGFLFALTGDKVYKYYPWESFGSMDEVVVYDTGDPVTIANISDAYEHMWAVADFGAAYLLTRFQGAIIVQNYHTNLADSGSSDYARYSTYHGSNAACNHRGRLVLGGFKYSPWDNSQWLDFFSSFFGESEISPGLNPFSTIDNNSFGSNTVWWSPIGSDPFLLYYPILNRMPSESRLLEIFKTNQTGSINLPVDEVLFIKELGSDIIVYCDSAVYKFYPISSPYPGYGNIKIYDYGVCQRDAIGGNDRVHFFVDAFGNLMRVTNDGVVRVGPEAPLINYTSSSYPRICYDNMYNTLYLLSNSDSIRYIFSNGLSRMPGPYSNTGFFYRSKELAVNSLYTNKSYGSSSASFTTNYLSMKSPGYKMLFMVEMYYNSSDSLDISVTVNGYDYPETASTGSVTVKMDNGVAHPMLTARYFTVTVTVDNAENLSIDNLRIHWQYIDDRYRRSIDVG